MNERIKLLAIQAGMGPWGIGNGDNVTEIVEKFAELIIRDVFVLIKEACLEGGESQIDEIIDDRLQDAAGDVVDAYGIVDRIY